MKRNFPVIASIILAVLVACGILYLRYASKQSADSLFAKEEQTTINIWYTDEALTDYINSAALSFYDEEGVRVVPTLVSGVEYFENINQASINTEDGPDLYITGSDSIEKAAMAGLATPISSDIYNVSNTDYPQTAIDAVTYKGQIYGYPFYYETAFLLYNKTYLNEMAQGDTVSANRLIPESIEDILDIANDYNAPEGVEAFFLWDVSDIFYNYFFTGAYMNIGGVSGDDSHVIDIYNEQTIECMQVYQELNQFFSIDSKESSYTNVLSEFVAGKSVFTIATTDALAILSEASQNGDFPYEYGVAHLPAVDADHQATGLAVTSCVIVNNYSNNYASANDFAYYLTNAQIDSFYDRTGKMPCANRADEYMVEPYNLVRNIYLDSVGLPKIIELNNFWIWLEAAYTNIWDGEDANKVLKELSERMKSQVSGEAVIETEIIITPITDEEISDVIDEDIDVGE